MFGSVVIDVVIAMALVFTLFSLVTSGLREVVAWLAKTRSKELWHSVRDLLEDPISNALRPLREAIAGQSGQAAAQNATTVDEAEHRLRDSRDEETTPDKWAAAVDTNVATLNDELVGLSDAAGLVADAETRLKSAYSKRDESWIVQGFRFFRRGGSEVRPRAPVVPTIGNVTALSESVRTGVRAFTDAVYDHPLVRQIDRTGPGRKSLMTRLDAGDLSGAALDLIQTAGVDQRIKDAWDQVLADIAANHPGQGLEETITPRLVALKGKITAGSANSALVTAAFDRLSRELAANVGIDITAAQARDMLAEVEARLAELAENGEPLDLIEAGLEALENIGPVREAVARAAAAARRTQTGAKDQVAEIATELGAWYDGRMDALTVWYRKRSRIVGFILAFLVVLGFNVDAIDIPQELWQNENVRSAVVAIAESSQLDLEECIAKEGDQAKECVEQNVEKLIETGLPLGWALSTTCDGDCAWLGEQLWHAAGIETGTRSGLFKLAGWLLAAAALTMGASFWFDVLRRATGIKATMKGGKQESQ